MRKLGLAWLTIGILVVGGLASSGCTDRTDCKVMKGRFDSCSEMLWNVLEPPLRGRATDAWRSSKNEQHFQYCQRVKGRYKQSAAINKCLREKDCAKFAACFCKVVKKKGCGQP